MSTDIEQKILPVRHKYVPISEAMLRAGIRFGDLNQAKLLFAVFCQLVPSRKNDHIVYSSIKDTVDVLGVKKDENKRRQYLKEQFEKVRQETYVNFSEESDSSWNIQGILYAHQGDTIRGYLANSINPELLEEHLECFVTDGQVRRYWKKVWVDDIYALPRAARGASSPYSACLYLALIAKSVSTSEVNEVLFTVKELKRLFGMKLEDYTETIADPEHPGETKLHFARKNFERKVLDKALREIAEYTEAVKLTSYGEGKDTVYYKKPKGEGGSVMGYLVTYRIVKDLDKGQNGQAVEQGDYLFRVFRETDPDLSEEELLSIVKKGKEAPERFLALYYNGLTDSDKRIQFIRSNLLRMRARDASGKNGVEKKGGYCVRMMDNEIRSFLVSDDGKSGMTADAARTCDAYEPELLEALANRASASEKSYRIDFEAVKEELCSDNDEISDIRKKTFIEPMTLLITGTDTFVVAVNGGLYAAEYSARKFRAELETVIRNRYRLDVTVLFLPEELAGKFKKR